MLFSNWGLTYENLLYSTVAEYNNDIDDIVRFTAVYIGPTVIYEGSADTIQVCTLPQFTAVDIASTWLGYVQHLMGGVGSVCEQIIHDYQWHATFTVF